MDNFIEMNNFQGIFDAIFNGNLNLYDILTLAEKLPKFVIKMIDFINTLPSNENKNKYFFIICYIITFRDDRANTIFEHLISVIGLDRFIEIVFQIEYGNDFDRIITNIGSNIKRMNDRQINIAKSQLFMRLLDIYSKKMSLDEFKFEELLKKLFSIQNNSFIKFILQDLSNFFTNSYVGYQKINQSFKLLNFLLENKAQFRNFIIIFRTIFDMRHPNSFYISSKTREIIGTLETQTELFRDLS